MPTIGVSIAVPDPFGTQLQDYRVSLGDEEARLIPTHITLVSPYDVAPALLPEIEQHLAEVAAGQAPFTIHLRGTGTFRPVSPVVFVGVVDGISRCEQLAARLRLGPLAQEVEFPFHPHVTVAHDLEEATLNRAFAELSGFEAQFDVSCFWLYVREEERGWRPVECYDLDGPPGKPTAT